VTGNKPARPPKCHQPTAGTAIFVPGDTSADRDEPQGRIPSKPGAQSQLPCPSPSSHMHLMSPLALCVPSPNALCFVPSPNSTGRLHALHCGRRVSATRICTVCLCLGSGLGKWYLFSELPEMLIFGGWNKKQKVSNRVHPRGKTKGIK
jgi:hypothetical protein